MAMARSPLTAHQLSRYCDRTYSSSDTLSMFSPSHVFIVLLLFSLFNGNSTPYISSSIVWKGLRISSDFPTPSRSVQSRIRDHSVPQITVSLVRQTAHNMHVARIASCIHVTKNSNNALTTAGFTP